MPVPLAADPNCMWRCWKTRRGPGAVVHTQVRLIVMAVTFPAASNTSLDGEHVAWHLIDSDARGAYKRTRCDATAPTWLKLEE